MPGVRQRNACGVLCLQLSGLTSSLPETVLSHLFSQVRRRALDTFTAALLDQTGGERARAQSRQRVSQLMGWTGSAARSALLSPNETASPSVLAMLL